MPKLKQLQITDNIYRLFFKAFSNKTRLEIIKLLRKGPLTVSEICKKTGFEQSRVSHNLKCLINCGFVKVKQNGNFRIYSLEEKAILPIINLLEKHIERYKERIMECIVIKNEEEQNKK